MGNPIWFVFWFLIFWFVSFIVAYISACIYVPLYVLIVCIPSLSGITDVLLQGIQFPNFCAKAMIDCKPLA